MSERQREAARQTGLANRQDGAEWATTDGYVQVSARWHPFARSNGTVLKHRLVAEKRLGRFLLPSEDVHHIDGDRTNNADENLAVMDEGAHARHHGTGKTASRETRNRQAAAHRRRWAQATPLKRKAWLRGFNSDDQRRAALAVARERLVSRKATS